jgi:hypothetical protein
LTRSIPAIVIPRKISRETRRSEAGGATSEITIAVTGAGLGRVLSLMRILAGEVRRIRRG